MRQPSLLNATEVMISVCAFLLSEMGVLRAAFQPTRAAFHTRKA